MDTGRTDQVANSTYSEAKGVDLSSAAARMKYDDTDPTRRIVLAQPVLFYRHILDMDFLHEVTYCRRRVRLYGHSRTALFIARPSVYMSVCLSVCLGKRTRRTRRNNTTTTNNNNNNNRRW